MQPATNKRRKISNFFGTIFTFSALSLLITSLVLYILNSKFAMATLFVSLLLNYLITACLSVDLLGSTRKSDSFVTFYIFIFLLFPFIGTFLYFFFGFDSIHRDNKEIYSKISKKYKRFRGQSNLEAFSLDQTNALGSKTFFYNLVKNDSQVYTNSDIKILSSSIEILNDMVRIFEGAKRFIHMEFYMFCDGLVFEYFLDIFKRKIKEGVEIRLIVDYVGNFGRLNRKSKKRLIDAGVQVRIFNPLFKFGNLWWQFRNHNKTIIVDNEYALCGSCNIADEYFNITSKYFPTTEISAKFSGDIVNSISVLFFEHWDLCNDKQRRWKIFNKSNEENLNYDYYFQTSLEDKGLDKSSLFQFLDNSPIHSESIVKDNLIQLIFNARKKIVISTPYFYPPKELINALKQASISGVKVQILVPKNPDLINFFRTLNRELFSVLLDQNVEIYEYFGFNHEKVMVIDDEIVYFGSYNWDYRALYLNFENAFLVKCKNTVAAMNNFLNDQFSNSHQIFASDLYSSKNLIYIFFRTFIRIFKPWL